MYSIFTYTFCQHPQSPSLGKAFRYPWHPAMDSACDVGHLVNALAKRPFDALVFGCDMVWLVCFSNLSSFFCWRLLIPQYWACHLNRVGCRVPIAGKLVFWPYRFCVFQKHELWAFKLFYTCFCLSCFEFAWSTYTCATMINSQVFY